MEHARADLADDCPAAVRRLASGEVKWRLEQREGERKPARLDLGVDFIWDVSDTAVPVKCSQR
jgi:hypothetical protein